MAHEIQFPKQQSACNPRDGQITVGFLIFPGFPMACLTSAIEPLRAANEISGTDVFAWRLVTESGDPVQASANVSFNPDCDLDSASGLNMLYLLSGPEGRFDGPKHAEAALRRLERHGTTVGAFSGGIFPLARSGLLDHHACSVHWCYKAAFEYAHPEVDSLDDVIVLGRRYTASGAEAVFDLMLHLIEDALGDRVMTEVACWFQHPHVRAQGVRQKIPSFYTDNTANALPPTVANAIELFSQNIEFPLSTHEVADKLGISARQLERSFKIAVGESPGKYYRSLRMRAARQLVTYSRDTITSIAHSVGYASPTALVKNYRKEFGVSPLEERRSFNLFRVQERRPLQATHDQSALLAAVTNA